MRAPSPFASLLAALFLAALFAVGTPGVHAQGAADGDALLDAWRAQQTARLRAVDGVAFAATLDRRVDGPMGDHRLRADTDVRLRLDGAAGAPRFDADVRALEVDGVPTDPADYERETHPLRRLLGPGASWLERPLTLPYPLLRVAEARDLLPETRDGQPVWRVPLTNLPPSVEAATVWFARDGDRLPATPRLLASEVQVRLEGGNPPQGRPPSGRPPRGDLPPRGAPPSRLRPGARARLDVTTTYARTGGLDLPAVQSLDFVAQQRRRIRTFTVLVEQQLQLRDVRLLE